jgi:lipopolysaccharide export system permease protein
MSFPCRRIQLVSPQHLVWGACCLTRFDRYLLSQLLALFGFFSLILVLIYWINRAVGLFDRLIGDGQSALVFLEISLLTLPNVIRLVLPVSAFAASVYVTNRLTQDGELVVMQATGFSAFRLARPVLYFGLCVTAMLLVLSNVVVPAASSTMADRTAEIRANVTAQLLADGRFMHPADDITFYISEISPTGELFEVFLSDNRIPENATIYTARRALLIRDGNAPKLLMFEGVIQTLNRNSKRLSVTNFADFTYDLGSVLQPASDQRRQLEQLSTWELLRPTPELLSEITKPRAAFQSEGHSRLAQPFLAATTSMIGFAALLLGAFSRFGLWRQILGAIVLLIIVQMVNNAAVAASLQAGSGLMFPYIAPLLGMGLSALMLWIAQKPRRRHRSGQDRVAA